MWGCRRSSPRATAVLAARIVREHGQAMQDNEVVARLGEYGVDRMRAMEAIRLAVFTGKLERVSVGATLALTVPAPASRHRAA
jgi:hypothetical protein